MADIKSIEAEVFTVVADGKEHLVEFKLNSLPNDMKMLAFLAGELSNSAHYFTTFANVNKSDCNKTDKTFSMIGGNTSWNPFSYEDRLNFAKLLKRKKLKKRM